MIYFPDLESFDFDAGIIESYQTGTIEGTRSVSRNNLLDTGKFTSSHVEIIADDGTIETSGEQDCTTYTCDGRSKRGALGAPRVMKNDIRRSFAKMYLNAINCGDFQKLQDFSQTFILPSCQFSASLRAKEEFRLPTNLYGVGPRTLIHHLLGCFVMFPDMVLTMGDVQIVTSNSWAGTKIVIPYECKFTKTHHIPTECWLPPPDKVEKMYEETSLEGMMAVLSVEDASKSKPRSEDLLANTQVVPKKRKRSPPKLTSSDQVPDSYAEKLLSGATPVPQTPALLAKGTYTILLDESNHVQNILLEFYQLEDDLTPLLTHTESA